MSKRALIILVILAIVVFGYIGFIAVSLTLCDESYTVQSYITYTIEPGEKKVILKTLNLWRTNNIEIVDCYLIACLKDDEQNILYSYDHNFDKHIGQRVEA